MHTFQKKSQATSKQDIDIAKELYKELMRGSK
ncbi:MAG: type II toxin-antitoxin system RelE/ParE family toxin [Gallionellaceae bacterium]